MVSGPFSIKFNLMPISSHAVIPYILEEVLKKNPKSVLDIGIGNGMYGALIYNYCETLMDQIPLIHGIEAWQIYRGPMWGCYDKVFVEDILDYKFTMQYDIIVMADVLEHFEQPVAMDLLDSLKQALTPGGVILISTPAIFIKQGAHMGNVFETHRCLFKPAMFEVLNYIPVRPPDETLLGEKMLIYKYTKTGG